MGVTFVGLFVFCVVLDRLWVLDLVECLRLLRGLFVMMFAVYWVCYCVVDMMMCLLVCLLGVGVRLLSLTCGVLGVCIWVLSLVLAWCVRMLLA